MEKPQILSEEQLNKYCERKQSDDCSTSPHSCHRCLCEAQLDADVAYYEHWYGKLLEDYKEVKTERAELLDKIQQAKAEVAREITPIKE